MRKERKHIVKEREKQTEKEFWCNVIQNALKDSCSYFSNILAKKLFCYFVLFLFLVLSFSFSWDCVLKNILGKYLHYLAKFIGN